MTAAGVPPGHREYLRRLPKVELHCHLVGAMRPGTAADLVRAHDVRLPVPVDALYARIESAPLDGPAYRRTAVPLPTAASVRGVAGAVGLLDASRWLMSAVREPDDFARVVYEAQEDAVLASNVRYREMFFEAPTFLELGVGYGRMLDGLVAGLRAAAHDFGITGRLIAGIDRSRPAGAALDLVEQLVADPRAEVIGIGLEGSELAGAPGAFADAYRLAARHGLHRTAHAGEHVPAATHVRTCLEVLGCERIDHGYFVLEDPEATARCRDEQVPFTCAFSTSRRSWIPWRRASVRRMVDAGLRVSLGSDDPAMFPTTLTDEYGQAADHLGLDLQRITGFAAEAIEAAWLPEDAKAVLRGELDEEATRLAADLVNTP